MNEPLDERYFKWLYEQVASTVRGRTYFKLLGQMFSKEFIWLVPHDDDRVQDGRDLRWEFVDHIRETVPAEWMMEGTSVLEVLMGLSRRLSFEAEGDSRDWFWDLMKNLELSTFKDNHFDGYIIEIEELLNQFVYRTYQSNGRGGAFPLENPREDQRKVDLWYQMNAYLIELE